MMWFWIRCVSKATSAGLEADSGVTPSDSLKTHAGVCEPFAQTQACGHGSTCYGPSQRRLPGRQR